MLKKIYLIIISLCLAVLPACSSTPAVTSDESSEAVCSKEDVDDYELPNVNAYDREVRSGDWKFIIKKNEASAVRCYAKTETATVPEYVEGKKVTEVIGFEPGMQHTNFFCKGGKVRHFIIPDTVKYVDMWAFANDPFETIEFGKNVEEIFVEDDYPDFMSSTLKTITVHPENRFYKSVDGVLYNRKMTKLCNYPPSREGDAFTVPNSVKRIGCGAFDSAKNLKYIHFSDRLTEIDWDAFICARQLRKVNFPESLRKIENSAFSGCKRLAEVKLNGELLSLGKEALEGTRFEKNLYADAKEGDLIYWGDILIGSKGISGTINVRNGTRMISDCAINLYSGGKLILPNTVKRIGVAAITFFEDCEVFLPKSLEYIDKYAFDFEYGNAEFTVYKDSYAHKYLKKNGFKKIKVI